MSAKQTSTSATQGAVARGGRGFKLRELLSSHGMLSVLLLMVIVLAVTTKGLFLSPDNLINVLRQISINAIIATGMTFVIITGGIDLSVGSIVALAGVVGASIVKLQLGVNVWWLVIAATLVGALIGAVAGLANGFSITRFAVPPFVATLAMMTVARGLSFIYTGGRPVWGLPVEFNALGRGYVLERLIGPVFPVPVLIMAVVMIAAHIVLSKTTFGRYVYAIGGNREAARLAGIDVRRVELSVYMLSGLLSGLAGVMLASRLASGQPNAGVMYELDAIAATVVGGTSLTGGVGRISGTLIGALIIGVIRNGLNLAGVESYTQQVVLGTVILSAVLLDQLRRKLQANN